MKSFNYIITDPDGIHARPAGILVKKAGGYSSNIQLAKGGKKADAKRIFGIMGLGVKAGDEVVVEAEGEDEEKAVDELKNFFETNL